MICLFIMNLFPLKILGNKSFASFFKFNCYFLTETAINHRSEKLAYENIYSTILLLKR